MLKVFKYLHEKKKQTRAIIFTPSALIPFLILVKGKAIFFCVSFFRGDQIQKPSWLNKNLVFSFQKITIDTDVLFQHESKIFF